MKRRVAALLVLSALSAPAPAAEVAIGRRLPEFTLADLAGRERDLGEFRGRTAVIIFIATRCPVSNDYNRRMAQLHAEYQPRGVAFIGINSNKNEPVAEVKEHAREHKLDFLILKDADNQVADLLGATRTPEVFVVDGAGLLRYHGRIDNSQDEARVASRDLQAALDALLAGQPVPNPETRFFGCTIKRVAR